jgi:hypothetical protein
MRPKLIVIKNFPIRLLAEQAKQSLEVEGISSLIQSSDVGILGLGSVGLPSGVDLYCHEEHAERAKEILLSLFDGI